MCTYRCVCVSARIVCVHVCVCVCEWISVGYRILTDDWSSSSIDFFYPIFHIKTITRFKPSFVTLDKKEIIVLLRAEDDCI